MGNSVIVHGGKRRLSIEVTCERCGRVTWKRRDGGIRFCSLKCSQAGERRIDTAARIDAFWALVDKSAAGGCWLWNGVLNNKGYGWFHWNGKPTYAHRLSYGWAYGDIPVGHGVLHRCDNPPCVNPAHLFTGTQKDNMADAEKKGRIDRVQLAHKMNAVRRARKAVNGHGPEPNPWGQR